MGLDFYLYEKTEEDKGGRSDYHLREVLYLSNSRAHVLVNWLDRNHIKRISNEIDEAYIFYEADEGVFRQLLSNLKTVLSQKDRHRRAISHCIIFL